MHGSLRWQETVFFQELWPEKILLVWPEACPLLGPQGRPQNLPAPVCGRDGILPAPRDCPGGSDLMPPRCPPFPGMFVVEISSIFPRRESRLPLSGPIPRGDKAMPTLSR